jgi:uncharacterized membrane protein
VSFSISTAAKGLGMGLAEVVPGVSGGTIAFITGIYEKLIASLRHIDSTALGHLRHGRFGDLVRDVLARMDAERVEEGAREILEAAGENRMNIFAAWIAAALLAAVAAMKIAS